MFSNVVLATSDPMLQNPFSSFEYGSATWDCLEPELFVANTPILPQNHLSSSSGSFESVEPKLSDQNLVSLNSGSDGSIPQASVIDKRKQRRMVSNRESARRSRMRKQKHLENVRNQVSRLRIENRDLSNRLRFVSYHFQRVRTENNQLRSEYSMLWQKLLTIRQILMSKPLQVHQLMLSSALSCNNFITTTEQIAPSIIT